jgi:hypothetical protein
MDRLSHIAFAKGLLKVAGENTNMAYLSIVPLIDAEPSFLHRLQCHPLVKGPLLVKCALNVFGSKSKPAPRVPEETYDLKRLLEEKDDIANTFMTTENAGLKDMEFDEGFGALLSVLSHPYFDTYNNAVQALAPYETYCAGQYEMWKKVDYFNFRVKWYKETAPQVREKVLSEDFWNVRFTAAEMVKGLIHRVAAFTQPGVPLESIRKIEKDLEVNDVPFNSEVEEFFIKLENSIETNLVKSVSEPVVQ